MNKQGLLIKTPLDCKEGGLSITYGVLPFGLDVSIEQENPNEYMITFSKKELNKKQPQEKLRERNISLTDLYEHCKDDISEYRASGNTTRMVDVAVQLLFNNYVVLVRDHAKSGLHVNANRELFKRIIHRMKSEHYWLYSSKEFIANERDLTIRLVNVDVDKKF